MARNLWKSDNESDIHFKKRGFYGVKVCNNLEQQNCSQVNHCYD